RADQVAEILRMEALATAAKDRAGSLRQQLADDARAELDQQGTAPSWRLPDLGTVALPLSKETAYISDIAALLAWCQQRYPGEVETIHQVRASFQAALLARTVPAGDVVVDPQTGEIVPGMSVRPGGVPGALTIRASREAKQVYAVVGAELLERLQPQRAAAAVHEPEEEEDVPAYVPEFGEPGYPGCPGCSRSVVQHDEGCSEDES
ncbi:hypothetical protein, partial [Actinoplanes lobatus]